MRLRLTAAILVASLAASASAQPELAPVPHGTFLLDQDSPENSESLWRTDEVDGLSAIHAKLTFKRAGAGQREPALAITLKNSNDKATFEAFTIPGRTRLTSFLDEDKDHSEKSATFNGIFASGFDVGEVVDLSVTWTAGGVITVTLRDKSSAMMSGGEERHTMTLRGAPSAITVASTNCEVEFNPFELGNTTN
jgi:hypothetical protein